jgi:hypothetical protein
MGERGGSNDRNGRSKEEGGSYKHKKIGLSRRLTKGVLIKDKRGFNLICEYNLTTPFY